MQLTTDEIKRYAQQIRLNEIGIQGQLKLKQARVLCIGAGGLGSSLLLYLAGAGIGTLGIMDHDVVELNNLQRQILYQETQLKQSKVYAAQTQLLLLNPNVELHIYRERLTADNAETILRQYDIIADCTDNFATHYLINDVCCDIKKPFVYASVARYSGQLSVIVPEHSACLRCLYPDEPQADELPDCSLGGVIGVVPGLFGVLQAAEIIKWIIGMGTSLAGHLFVMDMLRMQVKTIRLAKEPSCSFHC